jgi:hypothetical protein
LTGKDLRIWYPVKDVLGINYRYLMHLQHSNVTSGTGCLKAEVAFKPRKIFLFLPYLLLFKIQIAFAESAL